MVTLRGSAVAGDTPAPARETRTRDAFACQWEQDLRSAGIDRGPTLVIRYIVPGAVLVTLVATALLAAGSPDPGGSAAPLAFGLLGLASLPWLVWLLFGDRGPTWTNLTAILAPIFGIGIGHWFVDALSFHSSAAYPLLFFPALLIVILGLAVAENRAMAFGIPAMAAIASGGPLIAAVIAGKDVDLAGLMFWHVAFGLSVAAGWAAQMSYRANRAVSAAREEFARQEAAEERRRIARDVHDLVAHTLSVTMLHITAARMAVNREEPGVAATALEEAERQGRSSLADIRRMVVLLRDETAPGMEAVQPGLADIDALVAGYRAAGLPITLASTITASSTSSGAELALYRVLQEALANAARHGDGPATVALDASDAALHLRVDNPWRPGTTPSRGSGLTGMRERIAAAGGTIDLGVRDGRWVVQATIPGEALA